MEDFKNYEVEQDEVPPDEVTSDETIRGESFFQKVKSVSKEIVEEINNDPVMKWYARGAMFVTAVAIGIGVQKRYGSTYKDELEDITLLTSKPINEALDQIKANNKTRRLERKSSKKELKSALKSLKLKV